VVAIVFGVADVVAGAVDRLISHDGWHSTDNALSVKSLRGLLKKGWLIIPLGVIIVK